MNSPSAASACCYGKIPVLGDFVTRGLSAAVRDQWDEWLAAGMACARETLGDGWLDVYLDSPLWYFAAGAGTLDQATWAGVMIPSVDRVGRYFPFTVLRHLGRVSPLQAMSSAREWYALAEELALDTLADGFDAESLDHRLAALPEPEVAAAPAAGVGEVDPDESAGWFYRLGEAPATKDVLSTIADDCLAQLYPSHSVWWTAGSQAVAPALLVARGLPERDSFPSLMSGDFGDSRWRVGSTIGGDAQSAQAAADEPRNPPNGE